jgi:hypothetical protein
VGSQNSRRLGDSSRGTGDVEPLVNRRVDRGGSLVLALGDAEGGGLDAVVAVGDEGVGAGNYVSTSFLLGALILSKCNLQVDVTLGGLASDELLPGLGALTDDVHGVLLVLALAGEGELVLRLSVRDFVDAEPLVGGTEKTGQVPLDVLDVVEAGSERVVHVNDNDLPVSLTLVEESHDTKDLDLLDLTDLGDKLANLAHIERVVVTVHLGLRVGDVGVLPGLGEGTVVPEVALVGEAVADEAQLALLGVLLDGVEGLILGNLQVMLVSVCLIECPLALTCSIHCILANG